MFISKKTTIFKGFRGGPTFSRGGGGATFSRGVGRTPYPPSGSAHAISQLIFLSSKGNISCGFPKDPSQEDDSFEHQNKCSDL